MINNRNCMNNTQTNNIPLVIGISGKIGSGKDTLAGIIAKNMQLVRSVRGHTKTEIYKKFFAYKLKCVVELLTGITMTMVDEITYSEPVFDYTQEQKNIYLPEYDMTLGTMLQKVGTDAIRNNIHLDSWILALFTDIQHTNNNDVWLITDVRFKNEAESVKKHNGYLIRIDGDPMDVRKNSTRDLNHISETDLDDYDKFDFTISNDGTLEDLEKEVITILHAIFGHYLKCQKN